MESKQEKSTMTTKDGALRMSLPPNANLRRVNFNDLEAIMGISDDIYEGLDYIPALFYIILHSKQHEMYVYEIDGKVVSLANLQFPLGEESQVNLMSGRVHPSYQGQGLSKIVLLPLVQNHPEITKYFASTMLKPNIKDKVNEMEVACIMNFLLYKLSDRPRIERFVGFGWRPEGASKPKKIPHSKFIQWIYNSDQLIRFVSTYSRDFIPFGPIWAPIRVNREGLRYISSVANILATYSDHVTSPERGSSAVIPSGDQRAGGKTSHGRQVVGFSYSIVLPCKYGIRLDMVFYGDDCDVFISHFVTHLRHCVRITKDDVRIAYGVQFPPSISVQEVEEKLKGEIEPRVNNDYFSVTQVIHYRASIAQAKL